MKKSKIIWSILLSIIFFLLAILSYQGKLSSLDKNIYEKIILYKSKELTEIIKVITMFGGFLAVLIISNVIMFIDNKKGLFFLLNAFIILVLNTFLKNVFMIDRPSGINLVVENGYSFPSAHSMISVGVYGLVIIYLHNININKHVRKVLTFIASIIIIVVPLSRVYLGVHYFSDVFAGAIISTVWLLLYSEILRKNNVIK